MPTNPTLASGDEQSSDELFSGICALVRESGQTAVIATIVLLMVLSGMVGQMLADDSGLTIVRLFLLFPLTGSFVTAASFAVRSRQTLVRALSDLRARTGAPVDHRAPWTSIGYTVPLGEEALQREARRLIGAAWACAELGWRALCWALATGAVFIVWTIAAL